MISATTTTPPAYPTTALDRGLRLLQVVRDEGGIRVVEAAKELGVVPSTAHRLLQALVYRDFLTQDEDHTYVPGPALAADAANISWSRKLRQIAAPHLEALAEQVGNSTNLMIRVRHQVRLLSSIAVGGSTCDRRGAIMPAVKTAGGKSMLAHLPDPTLQEMFVAPRRQSALSSAEFEQLMTIINRIRQNDWAIANGEFERSVTAIGSAIRGPSGQPLGAVTISTVRRPELSGRKLGKAIQLLHDVRMSVEGEVRRSASNTELVVEAQLQPAL